MRGVPAVAANPREGSRLLRFWVRHPRIHFAAGDQAAITTERRIRTVDVLHWHAKAISSTRYGSVPAPVRAAPLRLGQRLCSGSECHNPGRGAGIMTPPRIVTIVPGRDTHDPAFLGLAGADEIANPDQAGGNANAHLDRLLDAQLADRFDERQPGPHRPLGIVLVRVRIAEIDEHPIAHIFSDEAVESCDRQEQIRRVRRRGAPRIDNNQSGAASGSLIVILNPAPASTAAPRPTCV